MFGHVYTRKVNLTAHMATGAGCLSSRPKMLHLRTLLRDGAQDAFAETGRCRIRNPCAPLDSPAAN